MVWQRALAASRRRCSGFCNVGGKSLMLKLSREREVPNSVVRNHDLGSIAVE